MKVAGRVPIYINKKQNPCRIKNCCSIKERIKSTAPAGMRIEQKQLQQISSSTIIIQPNSKITTQAKWKKRENLQTREEGWVGSDKTSCLTHPKQSKCDVMKLPSSVDLQHAKRAWRQQPRSRRSHLGAGVTRSELTHRPSMQGEEELQRLRYCPVLQQLPENCLHALVFGQQDEMACWPCLDFQTIITHRAKFIRIVTFAV